MSKAREHAQQEASGKEASTAPTPSPFRCWFITSSSAGYLPDTFVPGTGNPDK